jgi:hypothetical protein
VIEVSDIRDPRVLQILEIFRAEIGEHGVGMPFLGVRDNAGVLPSVAQEHGWRHHDCIPDIGQTFGTTIHLPKSVRFKQEEREELAKLTAPNLERTGFIVYRPGSGMGWHTNVGRPGKRYYYTYTEAGGRFRWAWDGTEHCINEPAGWHLKTFTIPTGPKQLLWHAIEAPSFRISIGFRLPPPTEA